MIEMIKILLEAMLRAWDPTTLKERREKEKLRQLGVHLYLLYIQMNEVYRNGKKLVEEIESHLRFVKRDSEATWRINNKQDVMIAAATQSHLLWQTLSTVQALGPELTVLDATLKEMLSDVIQTKMDRMRSHREILGEFFILQRPIARRSMPSSRHNDDVRARHILIASKRYEITSLDAEEWTMADIKKLEAYMNDLDPKATLAELEKLLAAFRDILSRQFNTTELLVEVGESFRSLGRHFGN